MYSFLHMHEPGIANAVRTAREAKGWSRRTLAKEAGVGERTVAAIELDGQNPRYDTLTAIARALDLPPATLLAGVS